MSVKIQSEKIEPDIVVVRLLGNITVGSEGHLLEPYLKDLLAQGARKVIFDLSGVDHLDSSGVELIFACSSAIRAANGQLRLAGATKRVLRLFTITRLDSVLSFSPTVEEASAGFAKA
jgi:anti-sigma B factor antagonist